MVSVAWKIGIALIFMFFALNQQLINPIKDTGTTMMSSVPIEQKAIATVDFVQQPATVPIWLIIVIIVFFAWLLMRM